MCRVFYLFSILLFSLAACNKNTDQLKTSINSVSSNSIKENILAIADSINKISVRAQKQESLIYNLGDYSFFISRFIQNSEAVLYIEHGKSGEYGHTEKRYYLKNGMVILLEQSSKDNKVYLPFKTERTYYNKGQPIYSERREARTAGELSGMNFKQQPASGNILKDMKKLNDAMYQKGDFDLVFEGITEFPKAKYLILSKRNLNAYRAPILVEKKDNFIEAIATNPEKYLGRKLRITWDLRKPNEAVYVSGSLY